MFNWKVEEMKIMNMTEEERIAFEAEVSMEDKIAFVDSMQEGKLSYIMGLAKKYQADMEKEHSGNPTDYQKRAWVRNNDYRELICRRSDYNGDYGDFLILKMGNLFIYPNRVGSRVSVTENEFIDNVFNEQLKACLYKERDYFNGTNENAVLFNEIDYLVDKFNLAFSDESDLRIWVTCPEDASDKGEVKLLNHKPFSKKVLNDSEIKDFKSMLENLDVYYAKVEEAKKIYDEARLSLLKTTKNWVE